MESQPWKDRPVAFFDFDRTLIESNSGLLYAKYERKHGRISILQFIESLIWGLLYHFNLINIDRVYAKAVSFYKGASSELMAQRTKEWFHQEVIEDIQPGAKKALAHHREQQQPCVLLTNSSCYLGKVAMEAYQLDGWLANHFSLDEQGCLTGEVQLPLCYGEGKVQQAKAWCEKHGADFENSTFYTDAYSDIEMLEAVRHPCVVNPDPKLRRVAKERGWPIYDWTQNK